MVHEQEIDLARRLLFSIEIKVDIFTLLKSFQIQSIKLLKHIISRVELIVKLLLMKEFALPHSDREERLFSEPKRNQIQEVTDKREAKKINRIRTSNHDDGTNTSTNFF